MGNVIDDEVLLALAKKSGGGSGGTSNYNELDNKPQINGTTLSGNKSLSDLGIMPQAGVVANPSDEATTELEKIKVGNAVYSIPEGGSSLTAGNYIEIDENNKINVKMEKGDTTEYEYRFTGAYSPVNQLTIEKYRDGVLVNTESYVNTTAYTPITIDGLFKIWYSAGYPKYYWCYKLLEDSREHSAGYEDSWYYTDTTTRTETFDVEDDSLTLVRKGDLDYADLSNKPQINSVELSGNKTATQLGLMASDGVVANPTGQTTGTLTALEVGGTKYTVPSGGTSDYTNLTNKPQINGVTLSGNKTENDLGLGYTTISYDDWLELTPQEQETGKWDVTGAPGGGGGSSQKAYGTAVDITSATQSTPYTCPSDGVVNLQSGYASSNYTALYKIGWSGFMAIAKGNESQANGAMTVPVLKGDQLYVTTSGTNPVANYYPYVDA